MGASAVLPGALLHLVGETTVAVGGAQHLVAVAAAASVAALASAGLTAAGVRRHDGRTVLLGIAFSTMTALLAVHALATPGVLVGPNGVIALAGGASLPAGATVLALTALPGLRRPRRMAPLLILQVALAAGIVALGAAGLLWPTLVPAVPKSGTTAAIVLMVLGVALYAVLANRALRTFALTRRTTNLVVAVGCAWLALALVATSPPRRRPSASTSATRSSSRASSCSACRSRSTCAAAVRRARRRPPRRRGGRLRGGLPRLPRARADGPPRRARRLDRGPLPSRRAARGPGRRGLGLAPATLRHLAVGGLLHDIGKLSVSAAILRKPGALTDDEYAAVKRHPEDGQRLLRELGGFPAEVHDLVGEHHERLDGAGYPRGLTASDLSLGPRILAVCDVYDALVSDRVYRDAWTSERALELLRRESGTAFDGECVEALADVVALDAVSAVEPAAGPLGALASGVPAAQPA